MSDEFDDEPRSRRKAKSSDSGSSALKILLIIFGSFAALALLVCCGVGSYGFFWFKKNLGQVALTAPADIQKLTAEMTDIDIPPEFVPKHGNSLFGVKTVMYEWCPTGTCDPAGFGSEMLTLTSFPAALQPNAGQSGLGLTDAQFSDESLKQTWLEYTKTEHVLDIRGKKCTFYVVRGEQLESAFMDDEEEDEGTTVIASNPQSEPAANSQPTNLERKGTGKKTVQVHGSFPGKTGEVNLDLHLSEESYNEEKVLGMLRSIR